MGLCPSWRFAFVGQVTNDVLGNRPFTPFVLSKDHRHRGLNVNDLNPSAVVGKQIDPSLTGLTHEVRGTEGERLAGA